MAFRYMVNCPMCSMTVPVKRLLEGPRMPELMVFWPLPRQHPGPGHLHTYVLPVSDGSVYAATYSQVATLAVELLGELWPYVPWLQRAFPVTADAITRQQSEIEVKLPSWQRSESDLILDLPAKMQQPAVVRQSASVRDVGSRLMAPGPSARPVEYLQALRDLARANPPNPEALTQPSTVRQQAKTRLLQ